MNNGDKSEPALDLLLSDDPKWVDMNAWRTKQPNNNYGDAEFVIAMSQYYPYGMDCFMFGGVYKITEKSPNVFKGVGYDLELTNIHEEYRKRLIIKLKRPIGRDTYNWLYENALNKLEPTVYELAPDTKLGPFPGYQNIHLTNKELQTVINEPSWKQALKNVKGVYVITDRKTGKHYIGSASGNTDGIWQRWQSYADTKNLTGGNIELEKIKAQEGMQYIVDNFTYAILEIFDTKTKMNNIIARENFWKTVLDTCAHGYNTK